MNGYNEYILTRKLFIFKRRITGVLFLNSLKFRIKGTEYPKLLDLLFISILYNLE